MQGYIAATIPATLDWSGKSSFVVFFGGCDFRCRYCFVPDYLDFKNDYLIDLKELKKEIRNSAELVESVFFTGGEPCLQKEALIDLARFCKKENLKVTLDTNGTRTDTIGFLIKNQLVDAVIMDIKTPFDEKTFDRLTKSKTFFKTTKEIITNIKETLELLKQNQNKLHIEFKTVIVPSFIFKKEDLVKIADLIKGFECRWVLHQFEPNSDKNLVDKNLKNISPPTKKFLENLRDSCQKKYPNLRIDIRSS
jgi:pyruvate formate lyase activating enzyme